jgi:uncharacterized membrane protein
MTRLAAGLALVGLAISAYLTVVHYAGVEPVCSAISDCARVQSSKYAELGGVPVAVIGLAGYVAILGSLAVPGENGRTLSAFLALVGAGFSAYLTYLEVFVIDAICQWCVASAIVMTALAGVCVARVALFGREADGRGVVPEVAARRRQDRAVNAPDGVRRGGSP